jgi:pimeloyl-ACP methyl ester carboxylesterase
MKLPTKYARSGDVSIAYQVSGGGPLDLVLVPGFVSHVEQQVEEPRSARFYERLASFSRLIRFDKRGTGLSDRTVPIPTLEQRMDDVRAVMDAVGSQRAALFGVSEGGPMAALFAATYPERTIALVLYGSFARSAWAPDYPLGRTAEERDARIAAMREAWGTGVLPVTFAPSLAGDPAYVEWCAAFERQSASPGAVEALQRMNWEIDARHVLDAIRVPTLVVHRSGDRVVRVGHGRYIAERVAGAKYVELPGDDHAPFVGDVDRLIGEIERFLTAARDAAEPDRVLATVLFTDVVGATQRAATLGDRQWRGLLDRHHAMVRRELAAFRGREIDTAGDGFLASFDGPARAIRAARTITDKVKLMGLDVRAGLHTGECEIIGAKLAGIAVHIGARIAALAGPGEVLVSSTVKDLVAGSGLRFEDRGAHVLKGVPGEWRLFAVDRNAAAAA